MPRLPRLILRALFALAVLSLAACAQLPQSGSTHTATPRVDSTHEYGSLSHLLQERGVKQNDQDLWQRIRRGYAIPDLHTDLAERQTDWYVQRPDYINRMTNRSRRYLYYIVEELEKRNMPTELALLPFVESAYNPTAYSSARASGIWQFIPSTGRYFALKQNSFHDDRNDVQASTRAALDYLQKLHNMFGDWHLALAAYNWGEGSVQRAMRRNEAEGLSTAYTDLTMPAETRLYVPKLQAIKNIITQPGLYGIELPYAPNHPFFRAVPIQRDIDVELAAQLAEVGIESFRELNPSAKKSLIVASHTPQILLPWDKAETFERNLRRHTGPLASHTAWVVPHTMSLADAADRSGTNAESLRSLNNIPGGMLIRSGSTLLIERLSHLPHEDISLDVAQGANLSLTPVAQPKPPAARTREVCTGKGKKRRCKQVAISSAKANSKTETTSKGRATNSGKTKGKAAPKATAKTAAKASKNTAPKKKR